MKNKREEIIFLILGILGLIVITVGVTYAFFHYVKEGTTENSITSGTITFLYTEVSEVGRGISIEDAYPMSDEIGKVQVGEGKVFDFKITSNTSDSISIPYEVTARRKSTSTLDENVVKLYLTEVDGNLEEEILLDNYSNLVQTTRVDSNRYIEKTIYEGKVPANSINYEKNFRLRMWIDESTDFGPIKGENGEDIYPYNGKEFTITINVYSNGKVVTEEEKVLEENVNIKSISVDNQVLEKLEGKDYDYEVVLPEETTSAVIGIETENPYANVKIEKIDSLAYSEGNHIQRLSTKKTVQLNPGNNYFKVTVTSEDNENKNEYSVRISIAETIRIFNKTFEVISKAPNLITTSQESNENGLYKSTDTISGEPTYYFRGKVENNYVDFAGFTWRVVRINEDGTIRLIMQDGINNNTGYAYNISHNDAFYMYYDTSLAEKHLETWYQDNLSVYDSMIINENYCGGFHTKSGDAWGNVPALENYLPTFQCPENEHNLKIGLITCDEVIYAGGVGKLENSSYYLYNENNSWTMSPSGTTSEARVWLINHSITSIVGSLYNGRITLGYTLRPVINIPM